MITDVRSFVNDW